MAILKIRAIDGIPPEQLGDVHVTVINGTTVTITQAMLMASNPSYFHENNRPLGSFKIVGFGENPSNLTRPTSGNGLLANLLNNGSVIRYNTTTEVFSNNPVSKERILANQFQVRGYALGSDFVYFTATSINSDNISESSYSDDIVKLYIHVVSSTNTKPTSVGNNQIDCPIGGTITLTPEMFTYGTTPPYSDAQNDPPKDVHITGVQNVGIFLYNGIPVTSGQIVTINEIALGMLKFTFNSDVSINTIDQITFGVSDTGTGLFTY